MGMQVGAYLDPAPTVWVATSTRETIVVNMHRFAEARREVSAFYQISNSKGK
jgi:hypothetical protein